MNKNMFKSSKNYDDIIVANSSYYGYLNWYILFVTGSQVPVELEHGVAVLLAAACQEPVLFRINGGKNVGNAGKMILY